MKKSRSTNSVFLDWDFVLQNEADEILIKVIDGVNYSTCDVEITYSDGDMYRKVSEGDTLRFPCYTREVDEAVVYFSNAEVVIIEVAYLKDGKNIGASLIQDSSCELRLLKYKVELPRGAKVTLFDDETLEAQFVAWNLPCPTTLPNMTFLQVKAANGFEQQITPSAGSYSVEVWTELGRRYAVFGEIWTYSFAQTLWFADLKVQLSNYDWVDIVPTAGEGGTIVTALPQ